MKTKVSILGVDWEIAYRSEEQDERLKDCDGYCDWTIHLIVVEKETEGNLGNMTAYMNKVARHEIVHAYLLECGLAESSCATQAWANNDEMVDWFARLGPQIFRNWCEAGVVDPVDTREQA